ncbi:MAG: 50S ribosomal protein L23 [Bacillota bacterium]|nr:50S ribosomal protein L23 [Bacillota bacterium]
MMEAREVIKRPLVTEKSAALGAENKYTFVVAPTANKTEIKRAVETIFKVKVQEVHTMRVRGKRRRMGRFEGRRPHWKKAVVTLRAGDRIELFEGR